MLSAHPQHVTDGRSGQVYSVFIYTNAPVGSDTTVTCTSSDVLVARLSELSVIIPSGDIGTTVEVTLDYTGTATIDFDGGTLGTATATFTVVDDPGLIDVSVPPIVRAWIPTTE